VPPSTNARQRSRRSYSVGSELEDGAAAQATRGQQAVGLAGLLGAEPGGDAQGQLPGCGQVAELGEFVVPAVVGVYEREHQPHAVPVGGRA
jgi:hypothetical protein